MPLQPFNTAAFVSVQFADVGAPQLCQWRPGHMDRQSGSVTKRPRAALLLLCGGHCRHVGMHPAVPASPSYSAAQPGTRARPSGRRQSVRCCAACALCVLYPVSHMILFHTVGCAWLYIMPTRRPGDCCSYVARIAEWRLCVCCLVKCVVMIGKRCLFFLFNVTTCGKSEVCSCCAVRAHCMTWPCVRVCRWPLGLNIVDASA